MPFARAAAWSAGGWTLAALIWNGNFGWAVWAALAPAALVAALAGGRPRTAAALAVPAVLLMLAAGAMIVPFMVEHRGFLTPVVLAAATLTLAALTVMLVTERPAGSGARLLILQTCFVASFIGIAEYDMRRKVTAAASLMGAQCLHAPSLAASAQGVWSSFRMTPYALVRLDDATLVWSFSQMRFFVIPETTARNIDHGPCPRQPPLPPEPIG
jgi:hypothetical protein